MVKKLSLILLAFLPLHCLAAVGSHNAGANYNVPATAETVTANLASTSYTIPATFGGWSEEEGDHVYFNVFNGSNTGLINLAKLLGTSGNLRLGGASQDTPNAVYSTVPPVTQTVANNLQAFVSALGSGWVVSWGLDAEANDSASAVTHAGYLLNAFGTNGVIFSIGNESEGWQQNTNNYGTIWAAYYTALTNAYSGIKFEATEVNPCTNQATWLGKISVSYTALQYVTCHSYPSGAPPLNAAGMIAFAKNLTGSTFTAANISSVGYKWRLGEFNMDYSVGISGVEDRLAASTYYLNMAINVAVNGGKGLNPHTTVLEYTRAAGISQGQPVWNIFYLQPDGNYLPSGMFWGMMLFQNIAGQQIVANSLSGSGNVAAIATVGANGNANIIVVNDDTNAPVVVTPAQSSSWTTAKVMTLAPSTNANCADQTPTIGGQKIGENGAWSGGFSTISNGGTVTLRPCGAALIEIQP